MSHGNWPVVRGVHNMHAIGRSSMYPASLHHWQGTLHAPGDNLLRSRILHPVKHDRRQHALRSALEQCKRDSVCWASVAVVGDSVDALPLSAHRIVWQHICQQHGVLPAHLDLCKVWMFLQNNVNFTAARAARGDTPVLVCCISLVWQVHCSFNAMLLALSSQ